MKRCARWLGVAVVASVVAIGCSSSKTSVGVTISPTSATVLINSGAQFVASVTGSSNTVNWSVNGVSGGNATVGTVTSTGFYAAPAAVPAGTTITVTATVSGTSASASATVTLDSGVRVVIAPTAFTVGTSETFPLTASVTGVPSNASIPGTCDNTTHTPVDCTAVTWSVTGVGSIDPTTGLYTAPSTTGSGVTVATATSVYDTTQKAAATISIVAAATPTIASISPVAGPIGAPFEDVFLTGTNFISTTRVFINGRPVSPANVISSVTTTLRVRVPDSFLSVLPTSPATTVPLTFTVASQSGTAQHCSPDCQLLLSPVRPAIVGTTPDSVPQGSTGALSFNVDGGFYGTTLSPVVTAEFNGQSRPPVINSTRQLSVNIGGSDVGTPGLFPVTVRSQVSGLPPATANLAVQPSYPTSAITPLATLGVGTKPAAVAVDTATGLAVVANQGSNDITLIDLSQATPTVVAASICTASVGATAPCPTSNPVGVAVDNLRHIALVANQGDPSVPDSQSVAVVDLNTRAVTAIIPSGATSIASIPAAVGIDPVSGRAIVAYQHAGFASIVDLTQSPPVVTGIASISTGPTPQVAVSPRLDWAFVTPGGLGSFSIVNLSQQTVVPIAAGSAGASRTSGTVTITTTSRHGLQVNQAVLINGVNDASFDGIFTVLSVPSSTTFTYAQSGSDATGGGGTVSFGAPVATVATNLSVSGVAFNDETEKAIFVDPGPNSGVPGSIFNALDQTSNSIKGLSSTGTIAAAMNPLANIAVTVNETTNEAAVIDPTTPTVLTTFPVGNHPVDVAVDPASNSAIIVNQNDNTVSVVSLGSIRSPQILQINPEQIVVGSTLASGVGAAGSPALQPQTVTIIGKGFTGSSVARLDGTSLPTSFVSDREITATVPTSMQTVPRRYALDVADSGNISNAAGFTVAQSVDVSSSTCSNPAPQGVSIDSQHNMVAVTDPGCNNVALIDLATGTGQTVDVGNNPQGVAVLPSSGLAVVANEEDNTASVVDEIGADVVATVNTDPGPTGVAIDPVLGEAVVTASKANVVDVFSVSSSPGTPTTVGVQQLPLSVAVDPTRHLAAVGNAASNSVTLVDLEASTTTAQVSSIELPFGIAFDPASATFLAASSVENQVLILDPATETTTLLRVGINPTSVAYNFATSTLVTTNGSSGTMTVVDFLAGRVRAVLPVESSSQFAVDIDPSTNLAVVADSAHGRVLLMPLPR
jgi:DNA-binding beta-propeller fold protein YncE